MDQSVPAFPGHHILKWNLLLSEKWGTKPFADVLRRLREEIEEKIATDVREDRSSALGATNRIGWVMMPPFYTDSFFELLEYELNSPLIMDEFSYVDWEPLDIARPFESLARRLLSIGTVNNELRLQRIAAVAERAKLNGVVLYNHFSGRCPMCRTTFNNRLVHDLGEKGIPVLVMDGDSVDPTIDPCSSATKLRAFVESLNKQRTGSIFG